MSGDPGLHHDESDVAGSARNRRLVGLLIVGCNIAVAIGLLLWVRKSISVQAIGAYLVSIPARSLLTLLGFNGALLLAYGLRLSRILDIRLLPGTAIVFLGFGLNALLPFRLGEIAKIGYASRFYGLAASALAASTSVEKAMDLGALVMLGLIATQSEYFAWVSGGVVALAALFGVAAIVGVAVLVLLRRWRAQGSLWRWLAEGADLLLRQLRPAQLLQLLGSTALIWSLTLVMASSTFGALFPQFTIWDSILLTLILALAIALPSTPAGIGLFEAGVTGYLHQVLNVEVNDALAAALAYHFFCTIPQIAGAVLAIALGQRSAARSKREERLQLRSP